jgi:uncharacterized protein YndB with AHSA1/START domain
VRGFEASSLIEASPEQVWPLLIDAAAWADWNSGVAKVEGRVALGEKLTITVEANPGRAFGVTVVELTAPERMVFSGCMPLGLFTGRRTYTLAPEAGGTRLKMREQYTGPLAPLIFRSIPDLGPSFRQFADGLADLVASRTK